jgi:hypothetical protein
MIGEGEYVIGLGCGCLESGEAGNEVVRDLVHLADLSDCGEEVVSRDGSLALKEREPEDLGVLCA